jgi:type II secretory pathway component PulC
VAGYDGTVQFTAPVYPGSDILIQVNDLDLDDPEIDVTVVNQLTNESEEVTG